MAKEKKTKTKKLKKAKKSELPQKKEAASAETSVKKEAKKAAGKKGAKRLLSKLGAASSKLASTLKRPIPKISASLKRRQVQVTDMVGMTSPEEIERIISQLSDLTPEVSAARETKFDIGVKHNGTAMAEQELPYEYGKDRVVMLVVDPNFVFTYWEVKDTSLAEATRSVGPDGKLTLRFYDVSNSYSPDEAHFWDVEVFDRLGNWYLKLTHPEQNLCMDIGVKNNRGHFYRIARSNLVKLPQQTLAKPGPIKWMVVTPSGEKSISDVEEYTDADLTLLKKILGPYFFDLLMRGRLASIAGSSVEAVFFNVEHLKQGASPQGSVPWATSR